MSEQQNGTPTNERAPAHQAVRLPLLVDFPWLNVADSKYEVVEVGLYEGQVDALCRCVSPDGHGESWWCRVRDLPGVTAEQRADLADLVQPVTPPSARADVDADLAARPSSNVERALARIRALIREGHEGNLRRQLGWLRIVDGEVFAIQTLGPKHGDASYLALCRSIEEAVALTAEAALVGPNKWGKVVEPILRQGVYIVANKLVGRLEEMFEPGRWQMMPEGVITGERIVSRREMYLDLDTQRRDEHGHPVDLPISATREELHKTIARSLVILDEMVAVLSVIGIDRPATVIAVMMSGNGIQLWFALAGIPESPELHAIIRELLAIWGALYDSEVSHVDTGVHDAKRIGPLAGTMKRKGLKTQLHRRVTFDGASDPRRLTMPELRALVGYYRTKLTPRQRGVVAKTLGVRRAPPKSQPTGHAGGGLSACNQVPIRDVAVKLSLDPKRPTCPSCESGGSGSDVAFLDNENLLNCKHNRCSARPNRTPVDLVALVEFRCDNIAGTKGVASKVVAWFQSNFGVGGRT